MRINLGACKFRVAQAVNGSFDLISYGLSISYLRFKRFRPSRSWYGHVSQNCPHLPPWTYHNHLNAWDMYSPVLSRHIVFIYEKEVRSRYTGDGLMSFPCVHATHVRFFGITLLIF